MLNSKVTTFDNGLRLVTTPMENTKAVTVLFLIGVGSRYEDKRLNGISHFLEHMFFKGTKNRPTTLDIAKSLDAVGAGYNAFTGEEYTGFYVRASSEHFDLALDIIYDMLYNSRFEESEIEREKGVIIEEINMYQDNPQSYIDEVAKKLLYADQPLGRQITGLKETVSRFKRDDFIAYREAFYSPDNMIISIAGGTNHSEWHEKILKLFKDKKDKKARTYEKIKEAQKEPGLSIYEKKTDQSHLFLGFRSIPRTHPDRPVLKVLNNLFGENMSSRLFTEVRERRGLAYHVSSSIADFIDTGAFGAAAGLDIARTEEAVKVILEEFRKIKNYPVLEDELHRAKENLKGRLYLGLEESFAVAEYLAEQQLFWGKAESPEELIAKYQKVTVDDIHKFANRYFVKENLNLALIGPFKEENKFKKLLGEF